MEKSLPSLVIRCFSALGVTAVLCAVLISAPASAAPSAFTDLVKYTNAQGDFSVLMYENPAKGKDIALQGGTKFQSLESRSKDGVWTVLYADLPAIGNPPYKPMKQNDALLAQTKFYVNQISDGKALISPSKGSTTGGCESEGVLKSKQWTDGRFSLRAMLIGQRVYLVVAEGSSAFVKGARTRAFFDSFSTSNLSSKKAENAGNSTLPGKSNPFEFAPNPKKK